VSPFRQRRTRKAAWRSRCSSLASSWFASRELVEIARAYAKLDDVAKYEADARRMIEVIEHHGWDGEWFLRAYDYFGNVVGSQSNDEGKIFAEPQGMCVMAGVGLNDGRADQAMASVRDLLATEHGVMLVQPSFTATTSNWVRSRRIRPVTRRTAASFATSIPGS